MPVSLMDVIDVVTVFDRQVPAPLSVLVRVTEVASVTRSSRLGNTGRTPSDENNLVPAQPESGVGLNAGCSVGRDAIANLDNPAA